MDEDDDHEFTLKCLLCFGLYLAFRGNDEHTFLRTHQVVVGRFEKDHPMEGALYVKTTHLNDKATKISFTNGRKRDTKRAMRLPVDPKNPACPGGTIYRYQQAHSPTADRFHTYPASIGDRKAYTKIGCPNVRYNPNKPIGKNKIGEFMKEACKKVGLTCTGHGLRAVAITTVVNTVANTKETLPFTRHNSTAAQQAYHRTNNATETARFTALGVGQALLVQHSTAVKGKPAGGEAKDDNAGAVDDEKEE